MEKCVFEIGFFLEWNIYKSNLKMYLFPVMSFSGKRNVITLGSSHYFFTKVQLSNIFYIAKGVSCTLNVLYD